MLLGCEVWHFGVHFALVEVVQVSELVALGLVGMTVVVLESTCSFSSSCKLLLCSIGKLLYGFQIFVVYTSQIIVLKLNMPQL